MLLLEPDAYRRVVRPLLFRLRPETAQKVADLALKLSWVWKAAGPALASSDHRLRASLAGIPLRSPLGLAAGYDKDCEHVAALSALGFGYLVGGTVTLEPRAGNPRPRVFRYAAQESLVNALGFPGQGLQRAEARLQRAARSGLRSPVVVSVSGTEEDDILTCHSRLEPLAAGIEVNVSSPNTQGLRLFQQRPRFDRLVGRISEQRRKPLFVKLPPYLSTPAPGIAQPPQAQEAAEEARRTVFELVDACISAGVDGVTLSNTHPVADSRLAVGAGGLSGRALFHDTVTMVSEISSYAGGRLAVNACGGIFTGEDAWTALKAGAATVQLLTGMIYRGPGAAMAINRELCALMDRDGLTRLPAPPAGEP